MQLSIVIPCLNEKETIVRCIEEAKQGILRLGISAEIIVADNGSSDGSVELARAAGARVVHVPVRGYGAALKAGILAAQGKYIVMGDSDGSYDFTQVPDFIRKFDEGYDIVLGNRFLGGIEPGAMPFLNQHLGNPVITVFTQILHGRAFGDTQCGLRGGTREALHSLNLQSDQFEYASEMVVKALRSNLRLAEIPVRLRHDHTDRKPHLRPWRDGLRHMRLIVAHAISRG
ncbi:MAG: glycosyltransferase family 2 protein [Patescibacteria group bacterium]